MQCPKCNSSTVMQVQLMLQAPGECSQNLSKKALRRKDVHVMGVLWETADYVCTNPQCGHVLDGYGNYVTNLAKANESLRQQLSACQSDSKDAWIRVEDRLPVGQQDVLFGSPEWGWPVVGMYTEEMPNPWSEYDQINDKYIEWEAEPPTLWMPKPKLPQALPHQHRSKRNE
jgi:hypothetical protein